MDTTTQRKVYEVMITEDKSEGGFVGRCAELHANSQGETFGEVMENIKDAMGLAIEDSENAIDYDLLITQK